MYRVYLGSWALPVAPSKIDITINNRNKTIDLINGKEINIIKSPGLSEVSFDALFPSTPFYWSKNTNVKMYINRLKSMKAKKKPFQFILSRSRNGKPLFNTNFKCTLEDYKIKEDADKYGTDIVCTIKLKEYVHYGTKVMPLPTEPQQEAQPQVTAPEPPREGEPEEASAGVYVVKSGDCLWNIAKQVYGDGSRYTEIAAANPQISNPNLIYPGQELKIP